MSDLQDWYRHGPVRAEEIASGTGEPVTPDEQSRADKCIEKSSENTFRKLTRR